MSDTSELTIAAIVPVYNSQDYLDAAFASLASQTRQVDEVMVINDGSTDGSAAIIERWRSFLPITLIDKPVNEGLGRGRNDAIEATDADLIAFLDSDDVWFPDHVETLLAVWEGPGCIAAAQPLSWYPTLDLDLSGPGAPIPPREEQRLAIYERNWVPVMTLFDRDTYVKSGGFGDLRKVEDWDLWIKMLRVGAWIVQAPHPTLLYRQRVDSLSAEQDVDVEIEVLEAARVQADTEARKVIDRTLRRYRARRELDAGLNAVRDGRTAAARWHFVKAGGIDRSLRHGTSSINGSVLLRAGLGFLAPRRAIRHQAKRLRQD